MTLSEHIAACQALVAEDPANGELDIVYECYSEQVLLRDGEIKIEEFCLPRPDGWVAHKRPDKPSKRYLVFPGN